MKKIRLKKENGKVYININTLRYCSCNLYVREDLAKNWIQINESDIKTFIAEQKAQIENSVVVNETTEVKTE